MHASRAFAAVLVFAALLGCGADTPVEPVRIEIKQEAVDAPAQPRHGATRSRPRAKSTRVGRTVSGTFRTAPVATAPAPLPTTATQAPQRPRRPDYARFRAGQLEVLRAHCASRPKHDPRCDGTDVDERVAFAPFEASR